MDIELNRVAGKLVDAWFGLYFIFNDNYTELMTKYNIKVNPEIEKAFKHIKNKLNIDYDFMELFFRDCSPTEEIKAIFPPFADSDFIFQFSTLESYLDFLNNVDAITVKKEFTQKILKLTDNDLEMTEALLKDEAKLIEQIDTLQISPDLKWRALSFIKKPMKDMKEYITLINKFFEIYESPSFKKFLKKHDNFYDNIEKLEEEEKIFFLKKHLGNYWNEGLIKEKTYLTTLFLNAMSAIFEGKNDTSFMFIGYKFNEVVQQISGNNEIDKKLLMLKNMSDSTRFKILMLLKDEELYGQQLADNVGITMSTISYHMNFLLAGGMVEMFERGHRTYYRIKKETFKEISEFIQKIFLN
jgi:DNA-binding transcriptional ArsR family regulator